MKTKILNLLETNAKMTPIEIAERLDAKVEDVIAAIADLEASKIICGYSAVIDWDKVSDDKVNALIEVSVTPQRGSGFDSIANRISRFPEVDSVYLLSGGYDFVVMMKGKSMREISKFVFEKLSTLEMIKSTATHFVLRKYKDHGISFEAKEEHKRDNILL
ncbi:MAG: Lrp/AsnC family transcriptional regulator [Bacilli bacterium]|nr:Lrp/AsnC family transcriptional regulator [Bacilli bacterium]